LRGDAAGHRRQVGQLILADDVHTRHHRHHGVVTLAGRQQAQGVGRGGGRHQILAIAHGDQLFVHDAVTVQGDTLSLQFLQRTDGRGFLAGEDGVIDNGMGRSEIYAGGPGFGPGNALQQVDPAGLQVAQLFRPAPQPELHLHTHHFGNGAGQFNVVAGRLAALIQEFIGGVIAVATHDDRPGNRTRRKPNAEQNRCYTPNQVPHDSSLLF